MRVDCFPDAIKSWPKATISTLAEVNPRYSIEKDVRYPFVEMAAVGEYFTGIQRFDWRAAEGSGLSKFKVDDTLFAKITPCPENGKVAFVGSLPAEVALGSTEFIVLSPRAGFNKRFLYHLVSSYSVRGHAVARMEGSTGRQRVPDDVFTKWLLVPVPSPDDQDDIASVLDRVDEFIDLVRSAILRFIRFKHALVQTLFRDGIRGEQLKKTTLGYIPRSWDVVPISTVVEAFQYGLSMPMHATGAVPILRMSNIQDGRIELDDLKYVTLSDAEMSSYGLQRGDVLFNRTNSQELVGKVGIYRSDVSAVFASYLIRLLANENHIDRYFLGHLLNSYPVQCRIKRYATPGVQQVNVNATNLGKVLIPLPTGDEGRDEQRKIAEILEQAEAKWQAYNAMVSALQSVKKGLLEDLLSGHVRASGARTMEAVLAS